MGTNIFDNYTNLYSVSKTLRFELIPQGKTRENIEKNGILFEDEARAENYKIVKSLIDEYHKRFISEVLTGLKLPETSDIFDLYCDENDADQMDAIMASMRKKIAKLFSDDPKFKDVFSLKTMIGREVLKVVSTEAERAAVESFQNFATYFAGFFDNRKNMYSAEAQGTSIANRIVNVNLLKFMDNIRVFETVLKTDCLQLPDLESSLGTILGDHVLEDLFDISKYDQFVRNEDIVIYNTILGGISTEDGKIQGINEYINLYNQKKEGRRLPLLKPLYKQILADRETYSHFEEQYNCDQDVIDEINGLIQILNSHLCSEGTLSTLLEGMKSYNLDGIYILNGIPLTDLSNRVTGSWSYVRECLEAEFDGLFPKKAKTKNEKYYEERSKYLKKEASISLGRLNSLAEEYKGGNYCFEDGYLNTKDYFEAYDISVSAAEQLLNSEAGEEKSFSKDKEAVKKIKDLLDAIKNIEKLIKPLFGKGTEPHKDEYFYGELQSEYDAISQVDRIYNKVRNYVTRKPYSTEKIKLNFQNATLLAGWDLNKERDNYSVILRKDGLFYLAIMTKSDTRVFESIPEVEGPFYEKMEYKLLPGPNKMLPKVFFAASNESLYQPSARILKIREKESFKKGPNFRKKDCMELIDFFKASIEKNEDWKVFGFEFSPTSEYADISQFYKEVQEQGYSIKFRDVPVSYIDQLVEEGKLYLFQIYNKDFSPYSKGKPNLHTLYWKALFTPENLEHTVYKLNGEAEVFYRKKSIAEEERIIHEKNHPILKRVAEEKGSVETSLFNYDIIKDRRYTVDKFQFHVPITMNFSAASSVKINDMVLDTIRDNDDIFVIGIDRGERNLLYMSLIDKGGRIVEQRSLNIITGDNGYERNYHKLLDKREREMKKAREDWASIDSIKELKEGYLSQAIHIITEWMAEYGAIIVLEDLNFGFKNGRKKVDKQVYQKFEKMLIDKLNYLSFKDREAGEEGGVLRGYQMALKFVSFQRLGKQSGFLFYIPAAYTSKIDPVTGFVNHFNFNDITNTEKRKEFLMKMERIEMRNGNIEFEFDYRKFKTFQTDYQNLWTVSTYGKRIVMKIDDKGYKQMIDYEPTKDIINAFKNKGIQLAEGSDLKSLIAHIEVNTVNASFFYALLYAFQKTLQMRNSNAVTEEDYILSPVAKDGHYFCSTDEANKGRDTLGNWVSKLPVDADANGAYHIALKGLYLLRNPETKKIENEKWLQFMVEKPYLE